MSDGINDGLGGHRDWQTLWNDWNEERQKAERYYRDIQSLQKERDEALALVRKVANSPNSILGESLKLKEVLIACLDALTWASGSYDFSPEGKACTGWNILARPAIENGLILIGGRLPPQQGHTAWRCHCGAWNHTSCWKCGKGPDERYANRAELDALGVGD